MDARFPSGIEQRRAVEVRAAGRGLAGYAAVFGIETTIGNFREVVMPGAFRRSLLSGRDVLALLDHDPTRLLARSSSGTLQLREDAKGLRFDVSLPDTALARDVLVLAERGDLGGASFAFVPAEEAWPAHDKRELRAVDLFEISIIHAWPAYPQTSVSARSRASAPMTALARRRWLDRC